MKSSIYFYTAVGKVLKVFVFPELVPDSASVAAEAVAAEKAPVPPPPQFDAPHFLDFTSSVLEALNTNATNFVALEMEAKEFSAPPPGPEEASNVYLHHNVIQKNDAGPAETAHDNVQGSSLGPVPDSQSITALEAQLLEAVTTEILMSCPQNLLTDSYISNERYVSISSCSLPLQGCYQRLLIYTSVILFETLEIWDGHIVHISCLERVFLPHTR